MPPIAASYMIPVDAGAFALEISEDYVSMCDNLPRKDQASSFPCPG
jgi:hypothetical protein